MAMPGAKVSWVLNPLAGGLTAAPSETSQVGGVRLPAPGLLVQPPCPLMACQWSPRMTLAWSPLREPSLPGNPSPAG